MKISFDPAKRELTLNERGIDFADARWVFSGETLDFQDDRKDYGETRIITVGHLFDRMMVVVWTTRGDVRHIVSMRKANEREIKKYRQRLEQD
ncbi:MAG: BrnT family toxin [Methylococcaceae bacterium]|nr:BrnT family toxin [Methylococcaceae bacterium]